MLIYQRKQSWQSLAGVGSFCLEVER